MSESKPDILDKLMDLHKQATTERSHYYVATCCKDAILEIVKLRQIITDMDAKEQRRLERLFRKASGQPVEDDQ